MRLTRRQLLVTFIATLTYGQDPLQVLPKNYRLVWQNDVVRAIHVTYLPLEKLPVHDHSAKPTIYVYLSDSGQVRFSHVEQPPFRLVRPAEKAGTFRFSPGRLEKHEVENLGNIPSEFLRIELTQLPLGSQAPFRSPKAFDGVHSGVRVEFDSPLVKIRRVVAAPGEPADVPVVAVPALLVAFSSTSVQSAGQKSLDIKCGDVLWMDSGHPFRASAADRRAAGHLLQILLEPKR